MVAFFLTTMYLDIQYYSIGLLFFTYYIVGKYLISDAVTCSYKWVIESFTRSKSLNHFVMKLLCFVQCT